MKTIRYITGLMLLLAIAFYGASAEATVTKVTLSSDKPSPNILGGVGSVTFTAVALDGAGPQEYEFWVMDPADTWTLMQTYSTTNTWIWTPSVEGSHIIRVYARDNGSAAAYEAIASRWFHLGSQAPVTHVSMTADKQTPSLLGTVGTVMFSAADFDGAGPQDFEFWLLPPGGIWNVVQPYSNNTTWSWAPSAEGNYLVRLYARGAGNITKFESERYMWFTVSANAPVTKLGFYSDKFSPGQAGSIGTVTFTANAIDGAGPQQYEFWVKDPGAPIYVVQAYSATNTYAWFPASPGSYVIQVRARGAGNNTEFETIRQILFNVGSSEPVRKLELTQDKASPGQLGTIGTVTFNAQALDGASPQEYQFELLSPDGIWNVVQSYGTVNNWYWSPGSEGSYLIKVMARGAGNPTDYDTVRYRWFHIGANQPVSGMSVGIDKKSPAHMAGLGTVNIMANAFDGAGPQEYEFCIQEPNGIWNVVQPYGTGNYYNWTPSMAGSYLIRVRARGAGNMTQYESERYVPFNIGTNLPVSKLKLTSDKKSPGLLVSLGAVTFTANALDGAGPQEYEFSILNSSASQWGVVQAYSTLNTWVWNPSQEGSYLIKVVARGAGNSTMYESQNYTWFHVSANQPVSKLRVQTDKPSPVQLGVDGTVSIIATAYDGAAPQQYEFQVLQPDGAWAIMQVYGTSNSMGWTPAAEGAYLIRVKARGNGNATDYDSQALFWYQVSSNEPVRKADLTSDFPSPNYLSNLSTVTFTATPYNGASPQEFEFSILEPNGIWNVVQPYSTSMQYFWNPTQQGSYLIMMKARGAGNLTAYDTQRYMWFHVGANMPVTQMAVVPDKFSPNNLGTVGTITFVANAIDGSGPQQYEFRLRDPDGSWSVPQSYGTVNIWNWTPTQQGSYIVRVMTRSAGNTTDFERDRYLWYNIGANQPVTQLEYSVDKPSPNQLGVMGTATFVANAIDGAGPQEYEFQVQGPEGMWDIVQPYGTTNNFAWTPSNQGSYVIRIMARGAGNTTEYERDKYIWFHLGFNTPVSSVSLNADKTSPGLLGTIGTVTFTATPTGGSTPEYQFWVQEPDGKWYLMQDFNTINTFAWTPSAMGTYRIKVIARSSGNTTIEEAVQYMWFVISGVS